MQRADSTDSTGNNHYILICTAIVLAVLTLAWLWVNWSTNKFHKIFTEPMLLKERDPEGLISQIEKACGVKIPKTAEKVLAAENTGSWDSSESDFVLRFELKTEQVDSFVKSLPGDIIKREYRLIDDSRKTKQLNQPAWFLEPISKGMIIEGIHKPGANGVIELIYVDTSKPDESLVYIIGS